MSARPHDPAKEPGGDRWLAIGLVVSVLVHAGAFVSLGVRAESPARTPHAMQTSNPDSEAAHPPVRFGALESRRVSINWLGIETPDPVHVAPMEGETEQAALTPDAAGAPAQRVTPPSAQPPQSSEPVEQTAERTPPPPARTNPVLAPPAQVAVVPEADALGPPSPPIERPAEQPADQVLETPEADASDDPALDVITSPAPITTEQPAAESGQGETRGTGAGADPGLPDERESLAIAYEKTLDIKDWTSPVVGEGLEIKTVRPRWPIHFIGTRLPRPAVIEITFRKREGKGIVRPARFLREQLPDGTVRVHTTGDAEIDAILINSVYNWTAKGPRIDALQGEESLVVKVRFGWVR